MTQDEIMALAKQAGFERLGVYAQFGDDWVCFTEELVKFAELISAAERKEWEVEFAGMGEWACVHLLQERNK
jgi:hypothetical protein